jgi:hypothetical protein
MQSEHPPLTQGGSLGTGCRTPALWHSWSHHTNQTRTLHVKHSTTQHNAGAATALQGECGDGAALHDNGWLAVHTQWEPTCSLCWQVVNTAEAHCC